MSDRRSYDRDAARARIMARLEQVENDADGGFVVWRDPKLDEVTGATRSTRWRWEKAGNFPKRIKIGPGVSGHLAAEVLAWMRAKLQEQ